ncbi:MAG: efflux transporter outer membrane subunit, partial [Acetobacteraceae bacterium]|nr:efflux transporter outer membrane subunit [Acetobacteraceae bacterium]
MRKGKCRWGAALLALPLAACMVGPDYRRPGAPVPSGYKELAGWKIAEPREAIDRGAWWSIYNDPLLDQLERQVAITNQNVKASEAAFRQAVALVGEAQANLFPVIAIDANATRNGFGSSRGVTGTSVSTTSVSAGTTSTSRTTTISRGEIDRSQYSLQGTVNWDLDVWGRIRRQIEGQAAAAQVSAADLANATLSAQATLATSYFNMRAGDSLQRLLEDTVAAYQRSLQITENQYNAGVASRADVLAAQAQLDAAQAQLQGVGVQRALNEHAIAVLTGHPPADLSIAPALLPEHVPVVPVGLPATLLERRPDIAAAERSMQQQNAQIGVAVAAYFP